MLSLFTSFRLTPTTLYFAPPSITPAPTLTPIKQDVFTPSVRPAVAASHFGQMTEEQVKRVKRETLELLTLYEKEPTKALRNQIVELNVGLVRKKAHGLLQRILKGSSVSLDDLTQVGAVGLIRAVERFELNRGNAFSSYAGECIFGEMMHYLRDKGYVIKQRPLKGTVLPAIKRLKKALEQTELTPEKRNKLELQLSIEQAAALSFGRVQELDAPIGTEEGASTYLDKLEARPEAALSYAERLDCLLAEHSEKIFPNQMLREEAFELFRLRLDKGLTLADTAKTLGVSPMTVSRREQKYATLIRDYIEEHGF
jgi:RNA polymerase sigma-B factor